MCLKEGKKCSVKQTDGIVHILEVGEDPSACLALGNAGSQRDGPGRWEKSVHIGLSTAGKYLILLYPLYCSEIRMRLFKSSHCCY